MKRFTTGATPARPSPGFGPVGRAAAPRRARADGAGRRRTSAHDLSPAAATACARFWDGGLHAKAHAPLLALPWRTWLFAGFGYALRVDAQPPASAHAAAGFLEVPRRARPRAQGVGATAMLFVELGARFGFGVRRAMYDRAAVRPGDCGDARTVYAGQDSFALSLSVGLSLDQ